MCSFLLHRLFPFLVETWEIGFPGTIRSKERIASPSTQHQTSARAGNLEFVEVPNRVRAKQRPQQGASQALSEP